MGQEVLKKFDRYFLLDCIAQGGMAEIFRARMASKDGAGRLVVIKRILAGYGRNSEFQKMFQSETKVMMGFNHPNVVQLYDYGEENAQPYIAMEFVDGRNLRQFISRFNEMNQRFPVDLVAYVIEQVAAGLHYAHFYKDKISGEHMHIIHRDVSPQNIIISYDGTVKIVDFGIAKVRTNGESTRVGIIKGKPSYLSPEQITGEPLDLRCDIFALGAVLWESLTGKKLFAAEKGENEFAVLKLIESADSYVKPPSSVNPEVPPDLDAIVMKALAKDRDDRYQTAEELQRALHRFLVGFAPDFNPTDLSYTAKNLFKDLIVADRKWVKKLNDRAETLLEGSRAEGVEAFIVTTSTHLEDGVPKSENEATFVDPRYDQSIKILGVDNKVRVEGMPVPDLKVDSRPLEHQGPRTLRGGTRGEGVRRPTRQNISNNRSRDRGKSLFSGFVAAIALALVGAFWFGDRYDWMALMPWGGPSRQLTSSGDTEAKKEAEESEIPVSKGEVQLKLDIRPNFGLAKIILNGKDVTVDVNGLKVELDKPLELEINDPEYKPFRAEFVVASSAMKGMKEKFMVVNLERRNVQVDHLGSEDLEGPQYGTLSLSSTPSSDATLWRVDPKTQRPLAKFRPWTVPTPFEAQALPVGAYVIKFENTLLGGSKVEKIFIEKNTTPKISVNLDLENTPGN